MIFSNDPRDAVRDLLKKGLENIQQDREQPQHDPSKVLTRETMPGKNPLEHGISPFNFMIGSILAFWINFIRGFWYWLPLMAAIIYFATTPEEMAKLIEAGASVSTAASGALIYAIMASFASLVTTTIVSIRLKRGEVIEKRSVFWLSVPSLFLASLCLYNLAFMLVLHFFY